MKYKCPDCKKRTLKKQVYTEEHCEDLECGHVNHHPHSSKNIRDYFEEEKQKEGEKK